MKNIILGFIAVLGLIGIVGAQEYNCPYSGMMGGYGGMMYGGYGSGAMVFGWAFSLLVVVLIVAAIYWLVKSANKKR